MEFRFYFYSYLISGDKNTDMFSENMKVKRKSLQPACYIVARMQTFARMFIVVHIFLLFWNIAFYASKLF